MKACGLVLGDRDALCPGLAAGQAEGPPRESPVAAPGAPVAHCPSRATIAAWPGSAAAAPASRDGARDGAWWTNSEVAKKLGLSEAQISQIERTFLEHRLRLVDLRADLEKQELRLQPLIEVDQPDEAKVAAQIDLITAARGRLEKGTR